MHINWSHDRTGHCCCKWPFQLLTPWFTTPMCTLVSTLILEIFAHALYWTSFTRLRSPGAKSCLSSPPVEFPRMELDWSPSCMRNCCYSVQLLQRVMRRLVQVNHKSQRLVSSKCEAKTPDCLQKCSLAVREKVKRPPASRDIYCTH